MKSRLMEYLPAIKQLNRGSRVGVLSGGKRVDGFSQEGVS
jgi:hypothetical protein